MAAREPTVLIVDDNVALAENLAEILASEGLAAASVATPEAALARVSEGDIAALITDFRLPGMNGADLIAEIRRRGYALPAIVVSAHTDPDTIASSGSAGALLVLPKPVDIGRLIETVGRLRDGAGQPILIVDDNRPFADNLAEGLSAAGHRVVTAHSIAEALALDAIPPVAIIDYRLPDGSGVDLAARLVRHHPRLQILFVSAYTSEINAHREVGPGLAAPCWEKPVDVSRLVEWVKASLTHAA
jgi:DNA-binding NtrC family response regulator